MIPAEKSVITDTTTGRFEIFSTSQLRPSAGKWTISGNFSVHVAKRPRWLTRKLMWWLIEWKWEDA